MEPSDYYDASLNKVLHFTRDAGLIKANQKGKQSTALKVAVQRPDLMVHLSYIHTYIQALRHESVWGSGCINPYFS
jgi:hypothetical protein